MLSKPIVMTFKILDTERNSAVGVTAVLLTSPGSLCRALTDLNFQLLQLPGGEKASSLLESSKNQIACPVSNAKGSMWHIKRTE
jgi:hypothetical protein